MPNFPSDPNSQLLLIKIRKENTHANILWQIWIQITALPLPSFVISDKRQAFTSKEDSLTFEKIEFYIFLFLKDYCFSRRGYGWNTYRNAWLEWENKYQKVIQEGSGVRWLISSGRQVTLWLNDFRQVAASLRLTFLICKRTYFIGLWWGLDVLNEIMHEHVNSVSA